MATKKEKFSKKDLVKIVNNKHVDRISFEDYFKRVILNFIEEERGNFDVVEIVILTCTLLEGVVKEKLKEINPTLLLDKIDPVEIAVVSNKQKKLLRNKEKDVFIKTAALRVLLDRYSLFFDFKKYSKGLLYLVNTRNNIVHSKDGCEINLLQLEANICKYIFPFLEKNILVSKQLWDNFNKIAENVDDRYLRQLMKQVVTCQKIARKLSEREINKRLDGEFVDTSTEFARTRDLYCPACELLSTDLIDGVDFDPEGPDDYTTHSYHYSVCRVCGLELDSSDIDAVLDNFDKFFENTNEDIADEWYGALDLHNHDDILNYI